jgi:hypothetical protein
MMAPLLILLSFGFLSAQTLYNGLINYGGRIVDCSHILNRYAHSGVPSIKEESKVKLCCTGVREIAKREGVNDLLLTHLNICRQLGR